LRRVVVDTNVLISSIFRRNEVRLDLAFRELTDHVADLFLIVGQDEIRERNLP
jgi:predicted nucleic acid-binding protein